MDLQFLETFKNMILETDDNNVYKNIGYIKRQEE